MHMSWPVSCAPPTPCQTPSTTSTPANPSRMPSTRRAESRSVRKINTATGSATSGVVAFQMPASTEETRCSPYPNRVNGIATPTPTTAMWPQVRRSRGSLTRVTSRTATSTSAPAATRPSVT